MPRLRRLCCCTQTGNRKALRSGNSGSKGWAQGDNRRTAGSQSPAGGPPDENARCLMHTSCDAKRRNAAHAASPPQLPPEPSACAGPSAWKPGKHGSEGAEAFSESSGELRGLRDEPACRQGLWAVLVLGFAGTGGVVLAGGGFAGVGVRWGVADGGGGVGAEYGGEVEWVGADCQGFFELAVGTEALEGGGQAGECFGEPGLADGRCVLAVCW